MRKNDHRVWQKTWGLVVLLTTVLASLLLACTYPTAMATVTLEGVSDGVDTAATIGSQKHTLGQAPVDPNPIGLPFSNLTGILMASVPAEDEFSESDQSIPEPIEIEHSATPTSNASNTTYGLPAVGLAAVAEKALNAPQSPVPTVAQTFDYETYLMRFIYRYNKTLPPEWNRAVAQTIIRCSQLYQVDYRLITSVIAVESSFRHDALSSAGAIGMGQLKPSTARWLGVVDPYNPIDNIAGMTRYLRWLTNKYNGSLAHAVSAYFQGPGTIDREGINPAAMGYLTKVNRVLQQF